MNRMVIDADRSPFRVSRHLYGHFAEHLGRCVYDGLWVGEESPIPNIGGLRRDVLEALRRLRVPNLRWPGGCFADTYHWKDGVGPREARPRIVNVHWGGTTEDNSFGTHEFLDLCEKLGCEPYIVGNLGSGTVREMAEWLEYLTHPGPGPMADLRARNGRPQPWSVTYWGVGNENWGCGGGMTAEHYANEFRRYATYCRHFGGGRLYKIACGFDDDWNETLLRLAARHMDGLSVHYYAFVESWEAKRSATGFDETQWYSLLRNGLAIEGFLRSTRTRLDRYDPEGRIGIVMDEWGSWYDPEPGTNPAFLFQQNTIRDAVLAAATLHAFHRHADRLHMANIAQTVNVLQAMVLTDGPRMLLTPTFHAFEMLREHQDGEHLPIHAKLARPVGAPEGVPQLSAAATRSNDGSIHVSFANLDASEEAEVEAELRGAEAQTCRSRLLHGSTLDARNTFEQPDSVRPTDWDEPSLQGGRLRLRLPPRSVAALRLC
ncbi:MAG: alpha-N-arabinofuranosidase [Fimbriimonadales bacterium]|nr:alpha-N-arabinofuranosidase [Fimbriimonadales bacterium]